MIVIHYMYLRGLRRLSYGRYAFAISVFEGIINVYYCIQAQVEHFLPEGTKWQTFLMQTLQSPKILCR